MHRHRFSDQLTAEEHIEHPGPPQGAFVMCPLAVQPGWQNQACPWQHVYELAFAQAQAVNRPSVLDRFQANNWN